MNFITVIMEIENNNDMFSEFDVVFYEALKTVFFVPQLSEYNFECMIKIVMYKLVETTCP